MKIFHNPEIQQINFLDERFYTVDNETFYPSVTTVLEVYPKGYGFIQWLKDNGNNADEVVRRAAEQGSNVHDAIDEYLKGNPIEWGANGSNYLFEEWQMICKFIEFWQALKPTLYASEVKIISEKFKLGGTIDIVCEINFNNKKERWLIDTKTSNGIHTSHELQLAAYAKMWNEQHPELKIDRTGVMWLKAQTRGADKKGVSIQGKGWQIKEFPRHYEDAFKLYEHTRAIWDEENPDYKPKNLTYPDRFQLQKTA